jgi:hypothetical protein
MTISSATVANKGSGTNQYSTYEGGTAGETDVIGDFWSSTLGNLAGGKAGKCMAAGTGESAGSDINGGPLSGGGSWGVGAMTGAVCHGGNGGIGAGGGRSVNSTYYYKVRGGDGGDGIIVIQYIP